LTDSLEPRGLSPLDLMPNPRTLLWITAAAVGAFYLAFQKKCLPQR
jgi:hypothetical protein